MRWAWASRPAAREPDLVAGADLGGDGHEALLHGLDGDTFELVVEDVAKASTIDETGPRKIEIEETKHLAACQFTGKLLQRAELARHVAPANDGADRGAGDDVGVDARGVEGPQHPDMRPSTGRAAPQCQSDLALTHCPVPTREVEPHAAGRPKGSATRPKRRRQA